MVVNDPDRTPAVFVQKVAYGFGAGWYEVVTVNGREYDQVDMGNARSWVPSRLTGNRFPSEREADLEWYGEVERLIEPRKWWLVVEESQTQVERFDLLVRRDRGSPARSGRTGATTADAMRERFMGEPFGMERLKAGADRVIKSGKAEKMIRHYLGGIR